MARPQRRRLPDGKLLSVFAVTSSLAINASPRPLPLFPAATAHRVSLSGVASVALVAPAATPDLFTNSIDSNHLLLFRLYVAM